MFLYLTIAYQELLCLINYTINKELLSSYFFTYCLERSISPQHLISAPFIKSPCKKSKNVISANPVDIERKLNAHKTLRSHPGRLLNVLCAFNLRPVSTGKGASSNHYGTPYNWVLYSLRKQKVSGYVLYS